MKEQIKEKKELKFKANLVNGKLEIKPIIERKGKDLILHMPSLKMINKFNTQLNKGGL